MLVHFTGAVPVKKNGKWIVVKEEYDKDIPDCSRHRMMCNVCGQASYPKCREWCPVDKEWVEKQRLQAEKEAEEKAEKQKVEFDILAGLVKDGLLKVEDAAPRIEMTAEEFTAAMNN